MNASVASTPSRSDTRVPTSPRRARLAAGLDAVEIAFDRAFGQAANPWRHLGALAYALFFVVAATGIYVYIGFDTRSDGAYASVERMSSNAFPLGSLMRSLHRYASDAMLLVTLLHLLREWLRGRYAHFRRFSWLTGVAALWLLFASGIGGFWLVWDQLAQYSLVATTEWLDALPVFGGALSRNFIVTDNVSDRLFSLLIFLHIGLPLALLAVMWVHVQRLSVPETSPPRALYWVTLMVLTSLSFARPIVSAAPAAAGIVPPLLEFDWYYLGIHAFADATSPAALWLAIGGGTLLLALLPWFGTAARSARPRPAVVDLANCNGCGRCFADCPYAAVTMQPRSDGRPLPRQAVVASDLCAGCGICAGACPSSTPFRSVAELVTGIDLPQLPITTARAMLDHELTRLRYAAGGPTMLIFGCRTEHGGVPLAPLSDETTAVVPLLCTAQLPPSFVEYALRSGVDGVLITGCRDGDCSFRLGNRLTSERMAGRREPHLRAAVPSKRVRVQWAGRGETARIRTALAAFRAELMALANTPLHAQRPKRLSETR
ncbi:MAG: hydrogenase iron-sulfur subunit [Burkholderiales bacterium]|nr:hydrogenase iron-sulfur subunit [Burkholderiales bacterium]